MKIRKFIHLSVVFFLAGKIVSAAPVDTLSVYQIQGTGSSSPVTGQTMVTHGVVTLTLFEPGQRNGFFIQDTAGDGNPATSDGIFVYGKQDVAAGNYIYVKGKVSEYNGRTQISGVEEVKVVSDNVEIPYRYVNFPIDFKENYESMEGMALCFDQRLYLNSTYQLQRYGQVTLGSKRLRSATDVCLPGSKEYEDLLSSNLEDELVLDDGSAYTNPDPVPFLDEDGTCRTGQTLSDFKAVLDQENERYFVYAIGNPGFEGNPRTMVPPLENLGNYELRIVGFNLEFFFNDEPLQTARIMSALWAMQADIYALVEVGGGKKVIQSLVDSLNRRDGGSDYAYVPWAGHESSSDYTMNHLVYRKSKVEPYRNSYMLNDVSPYNRKLIQCFTHQASGQKLIMSVCHFKAKSGNGSGMDADQGDGQGVFNYQRVREAYLVKNRLNELRYYYGTDHILLMGDLNSLYREDPIRIFTDNGYVEQVHRFTEENYSYVFDGRVQYLDYALASESLQAFVTGADIWHINADEPSFLDYDRDVSGSRGPFRSSDHDPVMVGVNFTSGGTGVEDDPFQKEPDLASGLGIHLYPNPVVDRLRFEVVSACTLGDGMVEEAGGKSSVRSGLGNVSSGELRIYSADGRQVSVQRMGDVAQEGHHLLNGELNVEGLTPGIYFFRLVLGNSVLTTRFVKVGTR